MNADRAMPLPSTLAHATGPKIFNETWLALEQARAAEVAAADRAILAELGSRASRPSLWRRASDAVCSETFLWVLLLVIVAALGSLLINGAGR